MKNTLYHLKRARDHFGELKKDPRIQIGLVDLAPVIPQLGLALELTRNTTRAETLLLIDNDNWNHIRESAERVLRETLAGDYEVTTGALVEHPNFDTVSYNVRGRIAKTFDWQDMEQCYLLMHHAIERIYNLN
jgi:hypothetical protein